MKMGILTSGGDCSGLNAVIRAIGLYAERNIKNAELIGIPGGYGGLIRGESEPLRRSDFEDILDRGGTILGTSRQPFKLMAVVENGPRLRNNAMVIPFNSNETVCVRFQRKQNAGFTARRTSRHPSHRTSHRNRSRRPSRSWRNRHRNQRMVLPR